MDSGISFYLAAFGVIVWLITILLPWKSWQVKEALDVSNFDFDHCDLSDVTVLIPARNEAEVIGSTLSGLKHQGSGLQIVLVDDDSSDGTAEVARKIGIENLTILRSKPLPTGWSGKLWAQEQGFRVIQTPLTLLLDADIELLPGIISTLKQKREAEKLHMISLMAVLRFDSVWEKLLMPAFIYFFKMLYPFALVNDPNSRLAAAAGGCILVDTQVLHEIGGMVAIKDAVIDDCSLAQTIKRSGYRIWLGLTHSALSQRPYVTLNEIWEMVARTAFTQLFYSVALLLFCTIIMVIMYIVPVLGVVIFQGLTFWMAVFAILAMAIAYMPTLNFYGFNMAWGFVMPLVAFLYLLMTWTSAWRYWKGERSRWKGRVYQKN